MKSLAGCLGSALLPGDHSVQHIKACHPTHAQPAGVGAGPLHPPGSPSMSNPPAQGSKKSSVLRTSCHCTKTLLRALLG